MAGRFYPDIKTQTWVYQKPWIGKRLMHSLAVPAALSGLAYGGSRLYNWWNRRTPRRRRYRPRRRYGRNYIRRVVRSMEETKYLDTTISSSTPISGTGEVYYINGSAEGNGSDEREGEKVRNVSIHIQGSLEGNTEATTDTVIRMMLVYAKRNVQGSAPGISEILEADNVNSLINQDVKGDYQVLWNKRLTLPMRALETSNIIPKRLVKYYKRWGKKPKLTTFDGATAAIGDLEKGGLFLYLMTDMATGQQPTFHLRVRVGFKEM